MQRKQVLGLDISPTSSNAKKLAQDLVSLQSQIYHMTLSIHMLDQDPNPGHTNYELNKFGLALAREIKNDLRDHPSKDIVKFYVSLLDECWNQRNYELGARVYQGINDAIKRDEIVLPKGVFELPQEDFAVKASRKKIEGFLGKIKMWAELSDKHFPTPAASKKLYEDHLPAEDLFVPSIQAVMNFIAIRLDNVKSILIDEKILEQDKYARLIEIKKEILDELKFIDNIMLNGMPIPQVLNFSSLENKFANELSLKLRPVSKSSEQVLDDLLKLNELLKPKKSSVDKAGGFSAKLFRSESPQVRKKKVSVNPGNLTDSDSLKPQSKNDSGSSASEPEKDKSPSPPTHRKG